MEVEPSDYICDIIDNQINKNNLYVGSIWSPTLSEYLHDMTFGDWIQYYLDGGVDAVMYVRTYTKSK